MFATDIYKARRQRLLGLMAENNAHGIALFLGNAEAPANYRGNDYKFRQDSSFLYFWGIDEPMFAAVLDLDSGEEEIYGDDVDLDDIIWMGPQNSVASKAAAVGVSRTYPYGDLASTVQMAKMQGRQIHYLRPARYYNTLVLAEMLGKKSSVIRSEASIALTRSVVALRLIKQNCEIEELDKAANLGVQMHTVGRKAIRTGVIEQEVAGAMEGFAQAKGWGVSFPSIVSQNGETLHNHSHHQIMTEGRLLVIDAGLESNSHYASDFTRTYPCGGQFTPEQRDIYNIVSECNELGFRLAKPGVTYREVHIEVAKKMLEGLRDMGFVNGDPAEMEAEGIAGLFQPHGLGHNMGIDVHDMEDLGEDFVGYDDDQQRGSYLGLANLRMARRLRPGHVITDEPGIYFIPALAEDFRKKGLDKGFVNFEKFSKFTGFGGIRLEDDVLITENGARRLGTSRLPITADEVEAAMAADKEE